MADVKSTLDILALGSLVYKVLSEERSREVWSTFKSLTARVAPRGAPASSAISALTPLTASVAVTVILSVLTAVTLP